MLATDVVYKLPCMGTGFLTTFSIIPYVYGRWNEFMPLPFCSHTSHFELFFYVVLLKISGNVMIQLSICRKETKT